MAESDSLLQQAMETARREGYAEGFAAAKRGCLLRAADDMNAVVHAAWLKHEEVLRQWAQELQQPLHTAIPDRDVKPIKNSVGPLTDH